MSPERQERMGKRAPHLAAPRGGPTKFTPERIQQIRNLVERGKSREEIAELIGVTLGSLQVTCSRLGISLRRPSRSDNGIRLLPRRNAVPRNGRTGPSSDSGVPPRPGASNASLSLGLRRFYERPDCAVHRFRRRPCVGDFPGARHAPFLVTLPHLPGEPLHRSDTHAVRLGRLDHARSSPQRGHDGSFDLGSSLGPAAVLALRLGSGHAG